MILSKRRTGKKNPRSRPIGICSVFILIIVLLGASSDAVPSPPVSFANHYLEVLPDGFDPWSAPVAGIEGETAVMVRRTSYHENLLLDIYYPSGVIPEVPAAAVVFVSGNSDITIRKEQGRPWMRGNQAMGWCRLAAENGLIALSYESGSSTADSLETLGCWLKDNARVYGIDTESTGLWSCSNGCGMTVAALREGYEAFGGIRPQFGVFLYGDLVPKSDQDLSIPVLAVRAAKDVQADGTLIERFVQRLNEKGGRAILLEHTTGDHAFDVRRDTAETRKVIRVILEFMVNPEI